MTSYKIAYDKSIADELKKRFSSEIAFLTDQGFTPFSLHQEIIFPFSMLLFFPVYLAMLGKEIVEIQFPLRITTYHLLYSLQTHATYAYVYGLGCKFYTNFTDGTWLVSNTRQKIRNDSVIVLSSQLEIALTSEVWRRHQEKIAELEAKGKVLNPRLAFDAWSSLEQQFDSGSMSSVVVTALTFIAIVICILFWLASKLTDLLGSG